MTVYSLIIDVTVLIIGILIVRSAFRSGFLRSVILTVGYVASILLAAYLSPYAAQGLYTGLLEQPIIESIDKVVAAGADAANLAEIIPSLLDRFPDFIVNPLLEGYGGETGLIAVLEKSTDGVLTNLGETISRTVVAPILQSVLQVLMCLLIFILCVIIVKAIASLFKRFYIVPVLGALNSALGAVIGVFQAAVILYLLALVSSVVISLTGGTLPWLNADVINSTYLFRLFYGLSFF